jgi:hypothetical protein
MAAEFRDNSSRPFLPPLTAPSPPCSSTTARFPRPALRCSSPPAIWQFGAGDPAPIPSCVSCVLTQLPQKPSRPPLTRRLTTSAAAPRPITWRFVYPPSQREAVSLVPRSLAAETRARRNPRRNPAAQHPRSRDTSSSRARASILGAPRASPPLCSDNASHRRQPRRRPSRPSRSSHALTRRRTSQSRPPPASPLGRTFTTPSSSPPPSRSLAP